MYEKNKFPFATDFPINCKRKEEQEGQIIPIDYQKIGLDLQALLRKKFSILSPISLKIKNNVFKQVAIALPFNDRFKYMIQIIIDFNIKTINLIYLLCRENGQFFCIESKAQRLLITRGLNKLNQTTELGAYCINNKGVIRFKQHIFMEHSCFNQIMEDYQQIREFKFNGRYKDMSETLKENMNFQVGKISDRTLVQLFQSNIEMHIQHLNINTAKILHLCDELPREYFGILERQGTLENQKQLDQVDNTYKEIDDTINSDKLFVEEISDTSAFQTPAQQVEQGLKTKIVQEIIVKEITNKETIGSGGFGDIYKAEIKFSGVKSTDINSELTEQPKNFTVQQQFIQTNKQNSFSSNNSTHLMSSTINSQTQQRSTESSNTSLTETSQNNGSAIQIEEERNEHVKTYVLKENKYDERDSSDRNRVQHEIDILMLLKEFECPYVAKYFYSLQEEYKKYLIIEFYRNKDLDSFRRNFSNTSSLISKIDLMYQFSSGLKFLNDRGFYHLDIKPANILVTNKQQIKITDFGECYHNDVCEEKYRCDWDNHFKEANKAHLDKIDWKIKEIQNRPQKKISFKPAKTMPYCPPESLCKELQINYQSDIFSLGIMMCEIFFDEFPFKFKKSKYTNIEEKYKEKRWESFMPEEYVCKHKGPEKIIKILLKLALRCLNVSKLEKDNDNNYKLDRPCISQIIIVLKKCKEYLEQRYINAFNKN